ncbi:hypothetical protein PR048_028096 [Dryococelus australis]|uniref:LIM zinc-binding domain-containing protein n=1 Tax=Dryococelus australis TaxID=614101 RepID=A0ABQ9GID1_9NEOP|nr:hypothetical protein PR048_028096 [Dryococelus australis]
MSFPEAPSSGFQLTNIQSRLASGFTFVKERRKRETPEKTRRPAASSGTIPNPGCDPAGDWTRFTSVGGGRANRSATADPPLSARGGGVYWKYNFGRGSGKLFGNTGHCAACSKVIPAFEMVMRARNNVYHLECFACQQCNHRLRHLISVVVKCVHCVYGPHHNVYNKNQQDDVNWMKGKIYKGLKKCSLYREQPIRNFTRLLHGCTKPPHTSGCEPAQWTCVEAARSQHVRRPVIPAQEEDMPALFSQVLICPAVSGCRRRTGHCEGNELAPSPTGDLIYSMFAASSLICHEKPSSKSPPLCRVWLFP